MSGDTVSEGLEANVQPLDDREISDQQETPRGRIVAGIDIDAVMASPAFWPAVVCIAGFVALFWSMVKFLPDMWMSEDGYYSHGFLVPPIAGYIVFRNWDKLKNRQVKPQYWAAVLLLPLLWLSYAAARTNNYTFSGLLMLAVLLVSTYLVAGYQWLKGLFWPIAYLGFALPLFQGFIEIWTNPLQVMSTKVAFHLLNLSGFNPYLDDAATIVLGRYTLNIAVPCSGLKLLLALGAFSLFFMLIANLKAWANAVMVMMWIPLALMINGLRIALIGVVGNTWGAKAGEQFHDYSGYITLLICFYILFRVARGLGWKD